MPRKLRFIREMRAGKAALGGAQCGRLEKPPA
jgi:hypothetical protein